MPHGPDQTISLGFTRERFSPGVHICQIFSNDDERLDLLLKFILSGLQAQERVSCFSDKTTELTAEEFLNKNGISYNAVKHSGAFTLAGTAEVYFKDACFDPERMLAVLKKYGEDATEQGYPAARVIGEMAPKVQDLPGGSRLLEYEAKISLLLRERPITCVCQYDARLFDGAVIMDILKVHPLMVVRGSVIHNPFFIKPEDFLNRPGEDISLPPKAKQPA